MTSPMPFMKILQQDYLNFVVTNFIPRRAATRLVGWFSKIEHPFICAVSLRIWAIFSGPDLTEAKETRFRSMHDCFTRQLKDGVRPIALDTTVLVSPCDGIVGAAGMVVNGQVMQVKGLPYTVAELFDDEAQAALYSNGCYVTLRLTASMYHRFHAPQDCRVDTVTHIYGDVWNVNPATLKQVKRLYCRNERAVIQTSLASTGQPLTLVAVAAVLVAGIRLNFLAMPIGRARKIRQTYPCAAPLLKGQEMGWFEHGSTIIVFAPNGFQLSDAVASGVTIRMGQPLLRHAAA